MGSDFSTEPDDVFRALFYGLGADGTVGANKNTIKIIGENPEFHAQGYFVYDSKKSGRRRSAMSFGPNPIRSAYLIRSAHFVGCHQFNFINKTRCAGTGDAGGDAAAQQPLQPDEVWQHLPKTVQQQLIDKKIKFYVIDAAKVARDSGMGTRTNTIMQTCFFAISGVPKAAIEKIKYSIRKTYGKKGEEIVRKNSRRWTTRSPICMRLRSRTRCPATSICCALFHRRRRSSCRR